MVDFTDRNFGYVNREDLSFEVRMLLHACNDHILHPVIMPNTKNANKHSVFFFPLSINAYIHRHNFPLAVPAAIQSLL